jgi:hypothetical protein
MNKKLSDRIFDREYKSKKDTSIITSSSIKENPPSTRKSKSKPVAISSHLVISKPPESKPVAISSQLVISKPPEAKKSRVKVADVLSNSITSLEKNLSNRLDNLKSSITPINSLLSKVDIIHNQLHILIKKSDELPTQFNNDATKNMYESRYTSIIQSLQLKCRTLAEESRTKGSIQIDVYKDELKTKNELIQKLNEELELKQSTITKLEDSIAILITTLEANNTPDTLSTIDVPQ